MGGWNRIEVGERHGSRVVIASAGGTSRRKKFRVRCDCGLEQVIEGTVFRQSLACKKCNTGGQRRKYGDRIIAQNNLYRIWIGMRRRCRLHTGSDRNARWADRGITVCVEWDASFVAFESWALANGYVDGLSIDRVNNDGNYEPNNCEWVTRSINSKRARALYRFVPRSRDRPLCFYDEGTYGDY